MRALMKSAVTDVVVAAARVSGESINVGPMPFTRTPRVAPLESEALGDLHDGALRREVGAGEGIADEPADRAHVDDAALALGEHLASEGLAAQVRALHVEADDEVELVLRELLRRAPEGGPGAVDEHVDAARFGDDLIGGAVARCLVDDVELLDDRGCTVVRR